MAINICEVSSRKDLKRFIFFPEKIHSKHKNWVPPIYDIEWDFYNPLKNRSFQHCTTILYLAYRDQNPVGRIMGIINHTYNSLHQENNARLFAFDCFNDYEVAQALTGAVEEWALKLGMKKVVGPLGFSDKEPMGFMIEGFDEPVAIDTNCSLPYMVELMKQCGYEKEVDLHEYKILVPPEIPDFYNTINKRVLRNQKITVLEFKSRKELKPFVIPVFELMNETYADLFGFMPLNASEIEYYAKNYLPLIHPEFAKIILDEDKKIVAFALAIPEISEGIRKAQGKLYPFGIFRILRAAKKTKMLTMLLGAIRQDMRGKGLDTLLGIKMIQSASKHKFEFADSHLVLETNSNMLAEYDRLGGHVYKRYRIFYKDL